MGVGRAPWRQTMLNKNVLPSRHVESLRQHSIAAAVVLALLIGWLGGWAAMTPIAGAVMASGAISVAGGIKRIQHAEGGIISEILVQNDQEVRAGDVLIRLDPLLARAELSIVMVQLRESLALQARLTAESMEGDSIVLPDIVAGWPPDPELSVLLAAQSRLRQTRQASLAGQLEQIDEQKSQQTTQIEGLLIQRRSIERQIELLSSEAGNLEALLAQGLVENARVNDLVRARTEHEGELGRVIAAIASARSSVAELEISRVRTKDEYQAGVLQQLALARQATQELLQRKAAAEDRLSRLDIRSPTDGTVYQLSVQTVGGIVNPGETLMQIVPAGEHLTLDVRLSPLDIDKAHMGQEVRVRLSGLDPRETPELAATINTIAPDLAQDPVTGAHYYLVQVAVDEDQSGLLPAGLTLTPGMPAEVFIQTGERTVLSYLLSPITDQLSRALRE